jgi:nucleoside-diphosphate-sugar epimerase
MVKSILLTGHTGFLGSVIYRSLVKDFDVYTLGRSKDCDYTVDFLNWDGRLELKHSIDAVVHVAGLAHWKAISDRDMLRVNYETVKSLVSICEVRGIKNFVFISSVAVYGKSFGSAIDETIECKPTSVYGESKLKSEKHIHNWVMQDSKRCQISLRLPLVLGPKPPGNLGKLIASIDSGKHIFLKGNEARKSVVFASDVASFISNWLKNDEKKSGTINLTSGEAPTFNWIEKTIRHYTGAKFFFAFPVGLLWKTIVQIKHRLGLSIPMLGKIFYPLTFSDHLARTTFNYQSKELNQTNFINEFNSNH